MKSKQHPANTFEIQFVPLHISSHQEGGVWFAKAEEFQVMGHGASEADAERIVYHMVLRAVFFAASQGNLAAILKKAGVKIQVGIPETEPAKSGQNSVWSVPIPKAA